MTNTLKSKAYIKCKHVINSCILPSQLEVAKRMVENVNGLIPQEEVNQLVNLWKSKRDSFNKTLTLKNQLN